MKECLEVFLYIKWEVEWGICETSDLLMNVAENIILYSNDNNNDDADKSESRYYMTILTVRSASQ